MFYWINHKWLITADKPRRGEKAIRQVPTTPPKPANRETTDRYRLIHPVSRRHFDTLTFESVSSPNNVQPATFVQLCTPRHVYLLNHSADVDFAVHRRDNQSHDPNMVSDRWGCCFGVMLPKYSLSARVGVTSSLYCLLQPPCYSSVSTNCSMLSPQLNRPRLGLQ